MSSCSTFKIAHKRLYLSLLAFIGTSPLALALASNPSTAGTKPLSDSRGGLLTRSQKIDPIVAIAKKAWPWELVFVFDRGTKPNFLSFYRR